MSRPDLSRQGATHGPPGERFEDAPDAADLPMIVWILGDESHADDFRLEAEEVMHRLGIRRSRLTQISGRELRVGRRRLGRYIRPVYRAIDVENYLAWTRPTASHVKSSLLVEKAVDELQGVSSSLQENLKQQAESLMQISTKEILGQTPRIESLRTGLAGQLQDLRQMNRQLGKLHSDLLALSGMERRSTTRVDKALDALASDHQQILQKLQTLTLAHLELQTLVLERERSREESHATLASALEQVFKLLESQNQERGQQRKVHFAMHSSTSPIPAFQRLGSKAENARPNSRFRHRSSSI